MLMNNVAPQLRLLACLALGIAVLVASVLIGGVLLTGTIVALCLVGSAVFTLNRLPTWCRRAITRWPLLTNIAATARTAFIVGTNTATGLVACVLTFLFVDLVQGIVMAGGHESVNVKFRPV